MNPLTQSKNATILPVLIALTLGCVALSPTSLAVTPAPDGGYPNNNTAEGEDALFSLTIGFDNTASGFDALYSNTSGYDNTANGVYALSSTRTGTTTQPTVGLRSIPTRPGATTRPLVLSRSCRIRPAPTIRQMVMGRSLCNFIGSENTANGSHALHSNTTGNDNTASGINALYSNTNASNNTASGFDALYANTTGGNNTAVGVSALTNNTNGGANAATGYNSLALNTTGVNNSALGAASLFSNSTGNNNTAVGINALENNKSGSSNIALGDSAGINLTIGSNNIDIGNKGVAGEAKTIRIGTKGTQTTTVIAGIRGTTIAGGIGVLIDANGRLGTTTSSARFKQNIQPMDRASEAILALQPVTFRYKHDLDPDGIPQFGLVAEQVAKVDADLVARDDDGKPYTVRYEAVNAMLLNEFLKEHRKVESARESHGRAKERERNHAGHAQSAGRANPEGERPAWDTGSCSSCGGE